ncbi:MAG: hypothetical protein JJU21_13905 [Salinarimonas sp.]|nr:hypothetical protein [Salinarimonas sp.]
MPAKRSFAIVRGLGAAAVLGATLGVPQSVNATEPSAPTRVTVAVTETIAGHNPHADSVSMMNGIWCKVYGCPVTYDFETGTFSSYMLESWGLKDPEEPTVWALQIKDGLMRHNGEQLVAADIAHSIDRIANDPNSRQTQNVRQVVEVRVIDDLNLEVVTDQPMVTLPTFMQNWIITSKALYDEFGPQVADREHPHGIGPYRLVDLSIGNYLVLEKVADHPRAHPDNPDEVILRIMPEPEQRVTALLNGEVQVAQFIPPQLVQRVDQAPHADIAWVDAMEIMFLAMNPETPPWDDVRARRAVAYAVNREALVRALLGGQATILNGPAGPGVVGYDPDMPTFYDYDPAKARALLEEAGLVGVEIDYYATIGRYIADRQISEAIVPMLEEAGFNVNFRTPEWSTLWADVQDGGVPFYYMGRGSVVDPSAALSQYFETGGSPRIAYSNPDLDALFARERAEFDPDQRDTLLREIFTLLAEDAPAHFLWRHRMAWGVSNDLEYDPRPDARLEAWDIFVR